MDGTNTTYSIKYERLIIFVLCIIGAVRIFVFNAAFPPFNNVDEPSHFDLVYKYSRGQIPRHGVEKFSLESLERIMLYSTMEYIKPADRPVPPPLWTIPNVQKSSAFMADLSQLQESTPNKHVGSFPVYYALAGLWYDVGKLLHLAGGQLIYWLRFLNVPLFVLLISVAYLLAKNLYPEADPARIALPLLVTVFPQDAFYSISDDALSPLLFAVAFLMLMQIYNRDKSYLYHFFAGIAAAAIFLTKISNIAALVMLAAGILFKLKKSYAEKQLGQNLPKLATLFAAAIIPITLWLLRNYFVLGDPLGNSEKVVYYGWTVKPLNELLNHPVFTAKGMVHFLAELTKSFWRGEFSWHGKPIASAPMDTFYVASSAIFILISCAAFLTKGKTIGQNRFEIGVSFLVSAISVLFLLALSIIFDFGDWRYPSRTNPYFTSGRLIDAAMLPFLVIYFDGLRRLLLFFKCRKYLLLLVAIIVIAITFSEIFESLPAFESQYNWFHLTSLGSP